MNMPLLLQDQASKLSGNGHFKSGFSPSIGALSPALLHILQEARQELSYRYGEETEKINIVGSREIEDLILRIARRLGFDLTSTERDEILAQLENDQKTFGILQPLVDDPQVSDIIITDYSKISVQQGRKNYTTGISFPNQSTYEVFVERLLQKAKTSFSTKKPIADGMIGTFARVHAVHSSLCETGPYVTIRLNRFSTVTVEDLSHHGTAPLALLEYLRTMVRAGRTILIVGEVGTGKTTLARALASSVSEEEAILVIEDTPEIRLEHPQVRYLTTREANVDGAGRVSPQECIRAGMRMAMNRIIFGEMRDAEAAEAFIDVCASGHAGLSTIHARSAQEAITRLELFLGRAQKGVERNILSEQIVTAVQVLVYVDICRVTRKRRIMEVREIGPYADGILRQRELFRYQIQGKLPHWKVVHKVSAHRDILESQQKPLRLSSYPDNLELSPEVLLRERSW